MLDAGMMDISYPSYFALALHLSSLLCKSSQPNQDHKFKHMQQEFACRRLNMEVSVAGKGEPRLQKLVNSGLSMCWIKI